MELRLGLPCLPYMKRYPVPIVSQLNTNFMGMFMMSENPFRLILLPSPNLLPILRLLDLPWLPLISLMFSSSISIDEEMRKEGMEGVLNQGGDAMVSTLVTHHAMAYCGFLTWPTGSHCSVLPSPCTCLYCSHPCTSDVPVALIAVSADDVSWRFCSDLLWIYVLMFVFCEA